MVTEVMRQSEDPRHVATADLGGRFAHFAIELRRLLDDEDSGVRTATFEHERCRGAGKRAANDRYIVIHGEENDARSRGERQLARFDAKWTIHFSTRTFVILSGAKDPTYGDNVTQSRLAITRALARSPRRLRDSG